MISCTYALPNPRTVMIVFQYTLQRNRYTLSPRTELLNRNDIQFHTLDSDAPGKV